jgi:hypothetical protein
MAMKGHIIDVGSLMDNFIDFCHADYLKGDN